MTFIHLFPSIIFYSLAVILTCLAIFQIRRERKNIYIRIRKIEDEMEILCTFFGMTKKQTKILIKFNI